MMVFMAAAAAPMTTAIAAVTAATQLFQLSGKEKFFPSQGGLPQHLLRSWWQVQRTQKESNGGKAIQSLLCPRSVLGVQRKQHVDLRI